MPDLLCTIAASNEQLEPLAHLPGMLGDGAGGSTVQTALTKASDGELLDSRREIRRLRTGRLEWETGHIPLFNADADAATLAFAGMQRAILRDNPSQAAYLTGVHLLGNADPIPLPSPPATNANRLVQYLRESTIRWTTGTSRGQLRKAAVCIILYFVTRPVKFGRAI